MAQGEVSNTTGIFCPGAASRAASWRALLSAASISPLDQNAGRSKVVLAFRRDQPIAGAGEHPRRDHAHILAVIARAAAPWRAWRSFRNRTGTPSPSGAGVRENCRAELGVHSGAPNSSRARRAPACIAEVPTILCTTSAPGQSDSCRRQSGGEMRRDGAADFL